MRLVPLGSDEYREWFDNAVDDYAVEKVRAGNWTPEEAPQRSREEFARLLPQGPATTGHYLMAIEDSASGAKVGVLWFAVDAGRRTAFIYDFLIHAPYRRQGYGRQALAALDELARQLGLKEIGLHVFGHNLAARALYDRAGYEVTNVNMTRRL